MKEQQEPICKHVKLMFIININISTKRYIFKPEKYELDTRTMILLLYAKEKQGA
jgi:hypothetical protein